jgi:hypothetical protein
MAADPRRVTLECPWFHVDAAVPAVHWHYQNGFNSFGSIASRGLGAGDTADNARIFVEILASSFSTSSSASSPFSSFIALELRLSDRVCRVKDLVHERLGILPRRQVLCFGNVLLPDNNKLKTHGVRHDSTLVLRVSDDRPVTWSRLATTACPGNTETQAAVFLQCYGSSLDVSCVDRDLLQLDRLSLDFSEHEEVNTPERFGLAGGACSLAWCSLLAHTGSCSPLPLTLGCR